MRSKFVLGLMISVLAIFSSTQSLAQWQRVTSNEPGSARHENGFVAHEGKLYLMGGRGNKSTEVFDPTTGAWETRSPPPVEIHHFTPISMDGKIYIVTALTGKYPRETALDRVLIYRPEADQWEYGDTIPYARRRGAAGVALLRNRIYIVGGIKEGHTRGTSNMADYYQPSSGEWTVLPDAPHIRDHSTLVAFGNALYALGGRNTSYHEPGRFNAFFEAVVSQVDVFSLKEEAWHTMKTRHPNPTAGAGVFVWGEHIYYAGGETGVIPAHASMMKYNPTKDSWNHAAPLSVGRHGTNAALIGDTAYIAGGSGRRGGRPELVALEQIQLQKKQKK